MSRYSKLLLLWTLAIIGSGITPLASQQIQLSGYVLDEATKEPLSFAAILIEGGNDEGEIADENGFFHFHLEPGTYHLYISHVGCEPERVYVTLKRDTLITFLLDHHHELLEEAKVTASTRNRNTVEQNRIELKQLNRSQGMSLADITEKTNGVSSIRTGSTVSKPIIHGLYGNRIAIIANGTVLASQRWGNDHAPELDPNSANSITVVKGVDALEYGGGTLGGAILIDAGGPTTDPHIHGSARYMYQANGRAHHASVRLEQALKPFSWRFTGSGSLGCDKRSPSYFLTNTGAKQVAFSTQLDKVVDDRWAHQAYYSYFTTEIGILRGAHISNLTDLQTAIGREEPFFTQNSFSYDIQAPRQRSTHHLARLNTTRYFDNDFSLKLAYSGQLNHRKEFDVRRGGRTNIPTLDLKLWSQQLNAAAEKKWNSLWSAKGGIQYRYDINNNTSGTGIFPLIPDYEMYELAAFARLRYGGEKWIHEAGIRQTLTQYSGFTFTRTTPVMAEAFDRQYATNSLLIATRRDWETLSVRISTGLAQRAPQPNELFSFGLHQGVAGIEEGTSDLSKELSWKTVASMVIKQPKWKFKAGAYYQYIDDYIFLEPQLEFRQTIRGAFPVYVYKATDATIAGIDAMLSWQPTDHWKWTTKYAVLRGTDRSNSRPLVYMPPDNLSSKLTHYLKDTRFFMQNEISLSANYVFEQTRWLPEAEFLAPPDAYLLIGAEAHSRISIDSSWLYLGLQADNVLNNTYRNYLNRLRYFADELGIDVRMSLRFEF